MESFLLCALVDAWNGKRAGEVDGMCHIAESEDNDVRRVRRVEGVVERIALQNGRER